MLIVWNDGAHAQTVTAPQWVLVVAEWGLSVGLPGARASRDLHQSYYQRCFNRPQPHLVSVPLGFVLVRVGIERSPLSKVTRWNSGCGTSLGKLGDKRVRY